jgi:two-component system sensor histidine kinase YesM
MKLRSRLLFSYFILISLPLIVLGALFYQSGLSVVSKQAQNNIYEIVKKNNEVLDTKLQQIDYDSLALFADKELFELFNDLDPTKEDELLAADRRISEIMSRYFAQNGDLYTYQIWTTYYTFGSQRSMPQGDPTQTKLYRRAQEGGGKLIWYPTYDFVEMFDQSWLSSANISEFRYLFAATRVLNFSHLTNSIIKNLRDDVERPVLTVSLKADLFHSLFASSIPEGSSYMVIDSNGSVVAHSNPEKVTTVFSEEWAKPLLMEGSGVQRIRLDGRKMIVCFDRSKTTDWLSVVIIPESALVAEIVPDILTSTLLLAIILSVVALTLAFFVLSRITVPVKKLVSAMRYVGDGDFHFRVTPTANDEIGILMQKFNTMSDRIENLVKENYEIKLKEQAAEIQALNLQINPHFLYNTLNVMNWMAIENNQRELSKMLVCLSNMLHYTTRKDWSAVHLSEEIEWMKNYFYIMSARMEDKFEVRFDIDPRMYAYKVPRLLFQPFVENAIIHGFDQIENGGVILITGTIDGDIRRYEITDNGRGMSEEMTARILSGESTSVGIQNTISRIKLRYGVQYGVLIHSLPGKGTRITIKLPVRSEE